MRLVKVVVALGLAALVLHQCIKPRTSGNEPPIGSTATYRVTEDLSFTYYEATYSGPDQSIYSMVRSASPIRQDGNTYLGYTSNSINWLFYRIEGRDGKCRITDVEVKYSGNITLPRLKGAGEVDMSKFENFLKALRTHEMGHYDIGKGVAETIAKGIADLPAMPSCSELDVRANALGSKILDDTKNSGPDYDRLTDFGRSQGAWLDF